MTDIDLLWELIEKGKQGKNKGLEFGMPKLQKLLGGIQLNRYYLISGATSAGKTALVLYMLYRLLKDYPNDPIYIVYFSLEIGAEILLSKLMSLYIAEEFGVYLTVNDVLSFESPLSDENYQYLQKAKDWVDSMKNRIAILDDGVCARTLYSKISQIFSKLGTSDENKRFIPNNPKLKVFGFFDHLALVRPEEGRTLKQEIDLFSSYLVTLKRKYPFSVFALIQQNRESSSVERRKLDLSEPGINDTKDSGAPAQDCDVLIQLFYPAREKLPVYRDYKIFGPNSFNNRFRSCIVSKNRYGIADRVIGCAFYGEVGYFKELPEGKEIADCSKYLDIHTNVYKKDSTVIDTEAKDEKIIYKF